MHVLKKCNCWNIKHETPCQNMPVRRCKDCGEELCGSCAKDHHTHDNFERIEPNAG